MAVTMHCSDSQGPATGPGVTGEGLGQLNTALAPSGALMAETFCLLTHTKVPARSGTGPSTDLRPLRPGDSLNNLQGITSELALHGQPGSCCLGPLQTQKRNLPVLLQGGLSCF